MNNHIVCYRVNVIVAQKLFIDVITKKVIKRQLVVLEVPSCPSAVQKRGEGRCACSTAP